MGKGAAFGLKKGAGIVTNNVQQDPFANPYAHQTGGGMIEASGPTAFNKDNDIVNPKDANEAMQKNQWQLLHLGAYLDWPSKYIPFLVKRAAKKDDKNLGASKFTKNKNTQPPVDEVNCRDRNSRTSLHIAAREDNYRFIRGLVEIHNLDVNAQDTKGWCPLHYAAQEGHTRVISALIYHKANANIKSLDGGRTPIHVALANGRQEVAKLLYYHGDADYQLSTSKKRNCVHLAAQFAGGFEMLATLMRTKKFDVNAQDKYGNTALHFAVKSGSLEMVTLLIHEYGAKLKIKNKAKMTPLHVAIYSGYFGIVEYLVKNGSSPKLLTGILLSILTSKERHLYADVILYIRTCLDRFLNKTLSLKAF